ncbi:MAG: exodeoxyribonuclease V alpha subunit [Chlamydiales bacterium]|jgi:exodeoxyribonuclease V alpha subunit
MLGLAKALFYEREKTFISPMENNSKCSWPIIEKLLSSGRLQFVDFAFAERLLKSLSGVNESNVAFLCHLLVSAREGHLCVKIDSEGIFPDPELSWLAPFNQSLDKKEIFPSLEEMCKIKLDVREGSKTFPNSLIQNVESSSTPPLVPICRFGNLFYLQRHWAYESLFLEHFQKLVSTEPSFNLRDDLVKDKVGILVEQGKLLPEQAHAIECACRNRFTIITGGPGTGKTYTAGYLIRIVIESLFHGEQKKFEVALASPTGKAAANLQASLTKVLEGFDSTLELSSKTLHSFLGISRRGNGKVFDANNPLSADFILVDESSMIDVRLMSQLLSAVKNGARLVLLGDKDQLPPVESGSLFADLTKLFRESERYAGNMVELKQCMRSDLKEIVNFSHLVNHGKSDEVLEVLSEATKDSPIQRLISGKKETMDTSLVLEEAKQNYPSYIDSSQNPGEIIEMFQKFRILSPLRKGPLGVDKINKELLEHFMKLSRYGEWFIAPIMIVSNHYRMELYNGEVGVLFRRLDKGEGDSENEQGDFAIFHGKSPNQPYYDESLQVRRFPEILLPSYEYAYCLSVHKSQGSEFDTVLLLMPEGSEIFGREVLYTAVTRARKKLKIFASNRVIEAVLQKCPQRVSGVGERVLR